LNSKKCISCPIGFCLDKSQGTCTEYKKVKINRYECLIANK